MSWRTDTVQPEKTQESIYTCIAFRVLHPFVTLLSTHSLAHMLLFFLGVPTIYFSFLEQTIYFTELIF